MLECTTPDFRGLVSGTTLITQHAEKYKYDTATMPMPQRRAYLLCNAAHVSLVAWLLCSGEEEKEEEQQRQQQQQQ